MLNGKLLGWSFNYLLEEIISTRNKYKVKQNNVESP